MKSKKPESSRLNLFYILQVLEKYTDENHPLSVAQIAEKINKDFGYLVLDNHLISTDTVKRILDELVDKIFPKGINYDEAAHQYGYCICCVMEKNGKFVSYIAEEGKTQPKKYYYLEDDLKTAEIVLLKNAIETYSYFSEEDVTSIVRKLISLRPSSFPKRKYIDVAKEDRDENSLLLMNIDELNDIITHNNCAKIEYCAYNMEKNLVPREGYPRVVEPIHLMWSNGYYYLLAYSQKYDDIVSYRVDRITDIEEIERDNRHLMIDFNPVQYRHEHPIMFSGKNEKVVLLCKNTESNHIMNVIVDTFGKKIRVSEADDELLIKHLGHKREYYKEKGIVWLKVTFYSALDGVELWATQYCNECVIISPQESANEVKMRLSQGLEYYK